MKTTKRFDNAVPKLYKAFHNNELNAWSCAACAVGTICDNRDIWSEIRNWDMDGTAKKKINNYVLDFIRPFGYSPPELATIEHLFLYGVKTDSERTESTNEEYEQPMRADKEKQFKGMCNVIEYLCELDNIPNVMDYTSLFEYKEKIKELVL